MLGKDVQCLIDDYGRTVTLTKVTEGTYNPVSSSNTVGATEVTYSVKARFAEYHSTEVDNDGVVLGDRKVLIGTTDIRGNSIPTPDPGDNLTGYGDEVRIVRVQEFHSGDTLVCFICQVRE